jgi:hypothetical protein
VAFYQETHRRLAAMNNVKEAIKDGSFINLQRLSTLNPQFMSDSK